MPRHPKRNKQEWVDAGYEIAVVVKAGVKKAAGGPGPDGSVHEYEPFHKMLSECWEFGPKISHIIPISDEKSAMESYREHGGAPPCEKCFPKSRKAKDDN